MMFRRTYYLPFLGRTIVPPSVFTPYTTNSPTAKSFELIDLNDATMVIYWAAKPLTEKGVVKGPFEAYGDFKNYGVSIVENGKANVKIDCPQPYKINKFGLIEKVQPHHIHYRTVHSNGVMGPVRTRYIADLCPP